MSLGKIYSYPNNWRVARARAAAVLGGKDFEVVEVTMEQFKTEYASKFPLGCVPAFEGTDGTLISDSMAIATYGAMAAPEGKLLSTDKTVAAQIAQWAAFADSEITAYHGAMSGMVAGYFAYAKPTYTSFAQKLESRLAVLNKYLEDKTYLVGDRVTFADVAVAGALFGAFTGKGHADAAVRAKVPNVVRFFETIVKSSKLAPVFGEVNYSETAPQYQAPKKDAPAKKAEAPKAPKAPKEKKPVEKDDDEEEEPLVPAEPKAKNPLDDLPKSNFNLENWKRVYSNEDTPKAMQYFYENFDTEGFSIWRIDFKYPTELTQVFMSSNLIGGLFARLEASRKYLFGSMGVLGKSNDSIISGIFVTRGQSIEDTISVAPDWESYTYTKLDTKSEADKEFIYKAMEWTLTLEGKEWADGKNFK